MYSKRHFKRLIKAEKEKLIGAKTNNYENDEASSALEFIEENLVEYNSVEEEEEVTANEDNLVSDLKDWAINNNITQKAFDNLLKLLNKWDKEVPRGCESLIKRSHCEISEVAPGTYLHIGLENQLQKIKNVIANLKTIEIDIGIDGLPLYKSSTLTLWPILAKIHPAVNTEIMIVGVFLGAKKPNSANSFLDAFAKEMSNILKNGINVNGNCVVIKLRAFICDSPARAFVCDTVGHNAFEGCGRCLQVGHRRNNTTVYSNVRSAARTNEDFYLRKFPGFHKHLNEKSVLEDIGVKMITQFPLDIMHLIDLGVMKKIMNCLMKGDLKEDNLNKQKIDDISLRLVSLYKHIPAEFARKPRSLFDFCRWKAVEFRQFLLYTGIFVLKDIVSPSVYDHFLLLHCSYRILLDERNFVVNLNVAEEMLRYFVELFPSIYK